MKTIDLVDTVTEIRGLTPTQIATMSEEERFKARVYLRVWLKRLSAVPPVLMASSDHEELLGDDAKRFEATESVNQRIMMLQ